MQALKRPPCTASSKPRPLGPSLGLPRLRGLPAGSAAGDCAGGGVFRPPGSGHRVGEGVPGQQWRHQQHPQHQQHQQHQQQTWTGPQQLPGAHSSGAPLKYAQMGHSSYGRGAPHVCYMQVGSQGMFYSRAHQEQQQQQHQGQQQLPSWGAQLAAHISHSTAAFLKGGRTGVLAAATTVGSSGAVAAVPPDSLLAAPGHPATHAPGGSSSSSSSGDGVGGVQLHWHVVVLQALVLAAVLLAGGLMLRHCFRSVVATLVACCSGLPFKA